MKSSEEVPCETASLIQWQMPWNLPLVVATGSSAVFSRSTIAAIEFVVSVELPSIIRWKRCPSGGAGDYCQRCCICSCILGSCCGG